MKNFSSKGIRFSGDSIKSCVGFIDLVDSTKNTITMEGLDYIRRYYSTFINSVSDLVKSYSGKVVKNIGDCLLFYFPKTTDVNNIVNLIYFLLSINLLLLVSVDCFKSIKSLLYASYSDTVFSIW